MLRDDLALNGASSAAVSASAAPARCLVDDKPVLSCITPISVAEGRRITTLEGLGTPDDPGPVQRAFIEEQAAQCGYCIPGMIMRAQALLERNPVAFGCGDPHPHER